jgi:hypothetical protein
MAGYKHGVEDKSMPGMGPRQAHGAMGLKKGNYLRTGIGSVEMCPYSECWGGKSNKGT